MMPAICGRQVEIRCTRIILKFNGLIWKKVHIPDSRFKQLDRNLKMTDFLYDDVTNSDLTLIRNRLKKVISI